MIDIINLVSTSIVKNKTCKWNITHKDFNSIECFVEIPWTRGKVVSYYLIFERNKTGGIFVKENPLNRKLPDFCPERHINYGGYFCLGVNELDNLLIIDEPSSDQWLNRLITYLKLQEKATILRNWDSDKEWMHGNAAEYQNVALISAKNLGNFFVKSINDKSIETKFFKRNSSSFLTVLFLQNNFKYTINLTSKKVTRLRSSCPCDNKIKGVRRIGRCGNHSKDLYLLGLAHYLMTAKEQEFWAGWIKQGIKCCGFCTSCKLTK